MPKDWIYIIPWTKSGDATKNKIFGWVMKRISEPMSSGQTKTKLVPVCSSAVETRAPIVLVIVLIHVWLYVLNVVQKGPCSLNIWVLVTLYASLKAYKDKTNEALQQTGTIDAVTTSKLQSKYAMANRTWPDLIIPYFYSICVDSKMKQFRQWSVLARIDTSIYSRHSRRQI